MKSVLIYPGWIQQALSSDWKTFKEFCRRSLSLSYLITSKVKFQKILYSSTTKLGALSYLITLQVKLKTALESSTTKLITLSILIKFKGKITDIFSVVNCKIFLHWLAGYRYLLHVWQTTNNYIIIH